MNKSSVANFFKGVQKTVTKHSPEILTGIGIAGMITTTVLAVKATPKAVRLIEAKKKELDTDKLPIVETVKTTWKCYLPTAITGAASITCLVGASSVSLRRNAALTAAYKLSETALAEYKEKVVETIGEKKEKTVREKVDKMHIEKNPVNNNEIIVTGKGSTRFLEPVSGRRFMFDIEKLKRAENTLNATLLHDITGYVSMNDLYDELGLEHTSLGDSIGWNTDELLDIDYSAQVDEDGVPCIVIDYRVPPRYGYDR